MSRPNHRRKAGQASAADPGEAVVVHGYSSSSLPAMGLAALGIVFGDIGTSPLYTLKTVLDLAGGAPSAATILGLLSLVIWTLFIITTVKYVALAGGKPIKSKSQNPFLGSQVTEPLPEQVVRRLAIGRVRPRKAFEDGHRELAGTRSRKTR